MSQGQDVVCGVATRQGVVVGRLDSSVRLAELDCGRMIIYVYIYRRKYNVCLRQFVRITYVPGLVN